ncbi:MAG: hypothetical protein COB02_09430 [Candidatus Cloacimonadota bacterium]|nr:MAG: hypothetical protein COB02_09430 [Candidatus Cloacimonadota bacterium]
MLNQKNCIIVLDMKTQDFDCLNQFTIDYNVSFLFVSSIPELINFLNDKAFQTVLIIFKDNEDAYFSGEVLDKLNDFTYIPRLIISSKKPEQNELFFINLPIQQKLFIDVYSSAIKEFQYYKDSSLKTVKKSIVAKQSGRFKIQTLSEARDLSRALSHLCNEPNRIAMGLTEILVNAIEHGNLGLSFDDKTKLQEEDALLLQIDYLLSLDENKSKYVEVSFEKYSDRVKFHIIDMGKGFDWKPYMHLDESRTQTSHGRGIAMANMLAFSEINYIYPGNQVELIVYLKDKNEPYSNFK